MIRILLRELKIEAAVGILDWELEGTQVLELSAEFEVDVEQALQSDAIEDTVDYAKLREEIQVFCRNHRFNLLEKLVNSLANHLFKNFPPIYSMRLELIKPSIFADANGAGVKILKIRDTSEEREFTPMLLRSTMRP